MENPRGCPPSSAKLGPSFSPPQLRQLRRIKLNRHSRKTLPNLPRNHPRLLGGLPALRNGGTQRRQELRNPQKRTRRDHKCLSFSSASRDFANGDETLHGSDI
ncbi:hypothetical protein Patl1_26351 [Pistacia atlantica]|uniref:Uncharacterized protein n=1 Tax=Pistacia atlantica TaxID=434234 RepID=A0ACC1B0R0_9ROSI|nr:hypothetical protein Patl1_26351 [Pistacia atlantica]